jgi:NAD(P)-dependent dehydrogenase (short-subunit alcohol dehydrogenase family)
VEKLNILITGATDGIGRQTSLDCLRRGMHVLVHARTLQRGEPVLKELQAAGEAELVVGDLASLAEVRARAARVVNVSSMAHEAGQLDFDNLQGERRFDGFSAYALSKLANVLFTLEAAERLRFERVTVNCLHPGVVTTKLLTRGFGITGIPVERGSRNVTHLALAPEVAGVTGNYFVACRPAPPAALARQAGVRRAFWELTESLIGQAPLYTRSTRPLIWQVTS